jgi:hypothetical protein
MTRAQGFKPAKEPPRPLWRAKEPKVVAKEHKTVDLAHPAVNLGEGDIEQFLYSAGSAYLDRAGRIVDPYDGMTFFLKVEGNPAGTTSNVDDSPTAVRQSRLFVFAPVFITGKVVGNTVVDIDIPIISLHDFDYAFSILVIGFHLFAKGIA